MTTRTDIDWEAIEIEYRAGQLSLRELGRQYNISYQAISKHAKKEVWKRNLSGMVRNELVEKLIKEDCGIINPRATDDDIVDQAAARTLQVVKSHRKDISQLSSIIQMLMADLTNNPTKSIAIGKGDKRHMEAVPLTSGDKSGIVRDIAQALAKLIPLHRQSYNIDTKTPTGSESDPIHIKHSMDTSGLQKAASAPKPCGLPQLGEGKVTE